MKTKRQIKRLKKTGLCHEDIGHGPGSMFWWLDNKGIIQWQTFGATQPHDISGLDMDTRWWGYLDNNGTCTVHHPVVMDAIDAKKIMALLPVGAMITLLHIGTTRYFLHTPKGFIRLPKRWQRRSRKGKK